MHGQNKSKNSSIYMNKLQLKNFILLLFLISAGDFVYSQSVDSVKVLQSGDYVQISYKIIDSYSDQVFRVSIKCSVNGGPLQDIKSYSGDAGENVAGGKSDYIVYWDFSKDIQNMTSVEFAVRAELISGRKSDAKGANPTGWDQKRFHASIVLQNKGPKYGIRLGYFGNWGVAAGIESGKMEVIRPGYTVPQAELSGKTAFNIDLIKRLANQLEFQCYLGIGISFSPSLFKDTNYDIYECKTLPGPHFNLTFALARITFAFGFCGVMGIGKIEHENNRESMSLITTDTYFDLAIGVRF